MSPDIKISKSDQFIRTLWLWTTIFFSLIFPLIQSFLSYILLKSGANSQEVQEVLKDAFANGALNIIFGIIWFAIIYHCAYKKHGNGWLFVTLVLSVCIGIPLLIYQLVYEEPKTNLFVILFQTLTLAWNVIITYLMIKVNERIQAQSVTNSEDYKFALIELQDSKNVDELDTKYSELSRKASGGDLANKNLAYIEAYKKIKANLKEDDE